MTTDTNKSLNDKIIDLLKKSVNRDLLLKLGIGTISWLILVPGFLLIFATDIFANILYRTDGSTIAQRNITFLYIMAFVFTIIYIILVFIALKEIQGKRNIISQIQNPDFQPKKVTFIYNPARPYDVGIEVGPYPAFYGVAISIILKENIEKQEIFALNKLDSVELYNSLLTRFPNTQFVADSLKKQ
ncbi:hypothetical protein JW887_04320 [Candidatus Dojkabacteria bacterium]|nr:hypothetical protein [Candidatus Dojkabacteria bacterium]